LQSGLGRLPVTAGQERLALVTQAAGDVRESLALSPRRRRLGPGFRIGPALGSNPLRLPLSAVRSRAGECVSIGERVERHRRPEIVESANGLDGRLHILLREVGRGSRTQRKQ